jgi:hypothetical protein
MAFITALATAAAGFIGVTSTIGVLLVRTAVTALVSYALSRSISKPQTRTGLDTGSRQMLSPATNHKVPVLYGSAFLAGAITDAVLLNNGTNYNVMWICLTISERTGKLFSTSADSAYTFNKCFRNTDQITFKSDGITVNNTTDSDGNTDDSMSGLIKIYMYAGSGASTDQIAPVASSCVGNTAPTLTAVNAWDAGMFPNWVAPSGTVPNDRMSDLVFALVRVEYNRDKNVTAIGDYQFNLSNSMTLGGDVIFDYMSNTRYGAGVRLPEIDMSTAETTAEIITRLDLENYDWVILE